MTNQLQKAKDKLIKMFVKEIKSVMATKEKVNHYHKIGWVDWVSDDLEQHEFVGLYFAINGKIMLVESKESKASKNLSVDEITDILQLEWIFKGLQENNNNLTSDTK